MIRRSMLSLLGLLVVAAMPGTALSAPQILAVLSPAGGVTLECDKRDCRAELTAYCLQRHRDAPDYRQDYRAAEPNDFALRVRTADGAERDLPVEGNVDFASDRGFMSVIAVVRPETVRRLGVVSGTLVAGSTATLVPVTGADDRNPLTPEEIANATGGLRKAGRTIVDASPNVSAALALGHLKRLLPAEQVDDPAFYDRLWDRTTARLEGRLGHPAGIARARVGYDQCMDRLIAPGRGGIKRCLEWQHDHLIREINKVYWDAQAGS